LGIHHLYLPKPYNIYKQLNRKNPTPYDMLKLSNLGPQAQCLGCAEALKKSKASPLTA